jgi:hypothetical protein
VGEEEANSTPPKKLDPPTKMCPPVQTRGQKGQKAQTVGAGT